MYVAILKNNKKLKKTTSQKEGSMSVYDVIKAKNEPGEITIFFPFEKKIMEKKTDFFKVRFNTLTFENCEKRQKICEKIKRA